MDGYGAMHTWAVTTKFADEKKRSSFFIESRGVGWVKRWIKLIKKCYLYPKCHLSCSLYPYTAKVDLNQVHTPRFPMVGKYDFVTIVART